MICSTRAVNGSMPVVSSHRAEQVRVVDVVGGQVGHRATAVVVEADPHHPGLSRRHAGVAAAAGLNGGFLIGRDHVLAVSQRVAVPDPGVDPVTKHPSRSHAHGRSAAVAGKLPRRPSNRLT